MSLISLAIGFAVGCVVTVLVPKVYSWVKAKVTPVEAPVAAAVATVKADVAAVKADVAKL